MGEKRSPSAEFLQSWNEFMSDTPITEAELKKPTEIFFRHCLIQILNQLHVDTASYDSMNNEIGSRLRNLRFKLMSSVNHFLSIPTCQKKMDLNYCNLINPTFKVVFNTLRYLLNYTFFVNMMYSNNIVECAKKVVERDNLRTIKNQLRKDIEQAKIEEENCVKQYRDLEKRIPQQNSTIATLQDKEGRLKQEIQRIEQDIEKTDMVLLELNSRKSSLTENIVNDQEAETIYATKELVERQLCEQEDFILAGRQKLKEHAGAIERLRTVTNKMENIHSEFVLDTSDIKVLRKNMINMEGNLNSLKISISQSTAEIESLTQNIKIKKDNIIKLNKKKDEIEATIGSKDKENLQILKQQASNLRKLAIKEEELLEIKTRIKHEFELLYKFSSNVIKQMCTSFYDC
jgi:DNA repair exonuclease SbcCD ATPase subunit